MIKIYAYIFVKNKCDKMKFNDGVTEEQAINVLNETVKSKEINGFLMPLNQEKKS